MSHSIAAPDNSKPPSKRLSKKRTKTGCLTCRKRRIKCDEGKPHCNNCLKTNRTCEGYKIRLDFREGLNAKYRKSEYETAYDMLPVAPVNLQIPNVPMHTIDLEIVQQDPTAFSQQKQKPLLESNVKSSPLQRVVPPSAPNTSNSRASWNQTFSPFPQLFHDIACANKQFLNTDSVAIYTPTASHSPLMTEKIFFLFNYFVNNFGSSMTIISRNPFVPNLLLSNVTDRRGLEHFWTYDAPLIAINSPHVLNAILALASVQYMNSTEPKYNNYIFNSMEYYQAAVCGLREDLKLQRHTDLLAALTTSLLLAFFETMYGDLTQWYKHMSGARDIINAMDLGRLAASAALLYENGPITNLNPQSIRAVQACDILSSFLHMELMQSAIGRTQLLLPVSFWDQIPLRRGQNRNVYMYDLLLKTSSKLTSWVAVDTERKEKLYGNKSELPSPVELSEHTTKEIEGARRSWNNIRSELQKFETDFSEHLRPISLRGRPLITPFGPSDNYASSLDHFFVILLNMSWLILKRNNPDVPAHGFKTLRYTAQDGVPNMLKIMRALPPAVPGSFGHIGKENMQPGQIIRLLVDSCVPIFFAAIQVREHVQQEWILNWLIQCHKYTGWNTVEKIMAGINKAWMFQKAEIAEMTKASLDSSGSSAGSMLSPNSEHGTPLTEPDSSPITSPGSSDPTGTVPEHPSTTKQDVILIEKAKGLL